MPALSCFYESHGYHTAAYTRMAASLLGLVAGVAGAGAALEGLANVDFLIQWPNNNK